MQYMFVCRVRGLGPRVLVHCVGLVVVALYELILVRLMGGGRFWVREGLSTGMKCVC